MKKLVLLSLSLFVGSALAVRAADAKATWDKDCAKCHGADGKGATKMGQKLGVKDLTDAKVQDAATDEAMAKAIKEGVKKDGQTKMKAFEDLSDADVKALVAYVRSLKK